jgi:hypothetical protein
MSGFANIARPGGIPTIGGGKDITPDSIFKNASERSRYEKLLSSSVQHGLNVKKVSVRIFDLSNDKQCRKYEKLWAELLLKVSKGQVVVETSKDLVHRPDGTSYWMKYVEYVEFETGAVSGTDRR